MRRIFAFLMLAWAALPMLTIAAPTVTLTASPTVAVAPASITLTWSSTEASTCTASGGWSGTKALSGTQTILGVSASTTYTLTCTVGAGIAQVTWTAPTTNTNGTALTNLAGFKLYWANTSAGVSTATATVINNPTATTYAVAGLSAGTWYFGARAFNTLGLDSDLSNIASKTITLASASANAAVTIGTQPNPPTLVTVNQTVHEVRYGVWDTALGRNVGTIPLGVSCDAFMVESSGVKYYAVPRDKVVLTKQPKSQTLVARCGTVG